MNKDHSQSQNAEPQGGPRTGVPRHTGTGKNKFQTQAGKAETDPAGASDNCDGLAGKNLYGIQKAGGQKYES